MSILKIEVPFYSAGRKYGWEGSPVGIGIRENYFKGEGTIEIQIGEKPQIYSIGKKEAYELVKKYRATFKAKNGVWLGVVPLSAFAAIHN